jgi:undecaprenyl-diphosphatase
MTAETPNQGTGGLIVGDLRAFAARWRRDARAVTPHLSAWKVAATVLLTCLGVVLLFRVDGAVSQAAKALPDGLVRFFGAITDFGTSGWMWATALALAAAASWARWKDGTRRDLAFAAFGERAMYVMATLAASGLMAQALKQIFGRARPRFLDTEGPLAFHGFAMKASWASFPSGHATTMFAMATAFGLLWPRWRLEWFALAVVIAASRVIVRAHYPADVFAGAVVGMASAYFVARAFARRDIALRFAQGRLAPRAPGLIASQARALKKQDS